MGCYIYKVTAQKKILADGREVNIAKFAYKPWFGFSEEAEKMNARLEKKSACHIARRYVKHSGNYTGMVVFGEDGEEPIHCDVGTFSDDWFFKKLETETA